jgi:hypothetical protein
MFFCPACKRPHSIRLGEHGWHWNQSVDAPTFTPSVAVTCKQLTQDEHGNWLGGRVRDAEGHAIDTYCHSFVTDGNIQFLSDSTHSLAGQTVPLSTWSEFYKS